MKHLFVPYELAVKLKEKGFDEPCFAAYMPSWDGSEHTIEFNPLKLDDRTHHMPLSQFYDSLNSFVKNDPLITYNFNELINEVDGEGNEYVEIYSAPLYQQVIDWFRVKQDTHIWITGVSIFEYTIATPEQIIHQHDGFEDYYETLTEAIEVALTLI